MALNTTLLLRGVQQFKRYYARQFAGVLEGTDLTMREMDVVLFLANNPRCDTAREVTELRGLAKSQVSGAVELLARKGLLRREPDPADRRVVHLSPTDGGQALAREGRQVQAACLETLFSGLTAEEAAMFQILLEKVLAAAQTQFQEEADG